jgi:hypothetical protein
MPTIALPLQPLGKGFRRPGAPGMVEQDEHGMSAAAAVPGSEEFFLDSEKRISTIFHIYISLISYNFSNDAQKREASQ